MNFIIGCNYWASNAGIEMWNNWNEAAIKEDLEILSSHGIRVMRVFPNWRDFQPVEPALGGGGYISEFRLRGGKIPENEYLIDETMLERFSHFCDLCEEYNIKLIVGLITGWMSGGLFIPPILFGRNLYTDPLALLLQQRFVKGMVTSFNDKKAIYAWDLGNECNCMNNVPDRFAASNWTGIIANTIRANDQSHPVVSGMHSIGVEDIGVNWTIEGQAEFCDILTTHPYPVFVPHAYKDKITSFRTLLHATCETKYYSDIGGKPGLVEEIGNLGPMFCDNDRAAAFMRVNLFSNWANGAMGVMWWCANEQLDLTTFPYTRKQCEVELGMIDRYRKPKPVLKETKRIEKIISDFDFELPKAEQDAICILTQQQDQWGAAYMTYCLAKQADMNIGFCYSADKIPQSDIYIMPSVCGFDVMPRENYLELAKRVREGATIYLSNDTAILAEFPEIFGMRVEESGLFSDSLSLEWGDVKIEFSRSKRLELTPCGAEVLACDSAGFPAITHHKYGRGKVYYINFPLETMLLDKNNAFDGDFYKIYSKLFEDKISSHEIIADNKLVGLTRHKSGNEIYCTAVNYSEVKQDIGLKIKDDYEIAEVYYGNTSVLAPFEAAVFKLKKNKDNV